MVKILSKQFEYLKKLCLKLNNDFEQRSFLGTMSRVEEKIAKSTIIKPMMRYFIYSIPISRPLNLVLNVDQGRVLII